MSQLARFDETIQDTAGNVIPGASVNIYRAGAFVNGNQAGVSPLTVTVRSTGHITTNSGSPDVIFVDGITGTTYSGYASSGTQIILSGFAGTLSLLNGQRLIPANNQPAIYSDDQGGAALTQPLIADASGRVNGWSSGGAVDLVASGAGISPPLVFPGQVLVGEAPSIVISSAFDGASAVAHILDTVYQLVTAGAKILSIRNFGSEVWYVDKSGNVGVVNITATGTLSLTGAATLLSTLTVSGVVTLNALVTALAGFALTGTLTLNTAASKIVPGATSLSIRNHADSQDNLLVIDAGDITAKRDVLSRRLRARQGTVVSISNFTLVNWGSGASIAPADCYDTSGKVTVTCGTGPSASPEVQLTFADGTWGSIPPIPMVCNSQPQTGAQTRWIASFGDSTFMRFILDGTPSSGLTYAFMYGMFA